MTTKEINELIRSRRYPTDNEIIAMTAAQRKKVTEKTGYKLVIKKQMNTLDQIKW